MLQSALGIVVIILLAWALGERRGRIGLRIVVAGLGLQFAIAAVMLKVPALQGVFLWLNHAVLAVEEATRAGTSFVFGYLGGGTLPFEATSPSDTWIFAFRALPIILVVSALSALLYHWRIIPLIVRGFSLLLERSMGIGGALGVGVAGNVFGGMIEAPLLIRPYLLRMSRGELFALMVSGMATIAGTMLVIYATLLRDIVPNALGQIITASLISCPAAVLLALLMVPSDAEPTGGGAAPPSEASGSVDAVVRGTMDGITLLLAVTAMLVVFVAVVSLADQALGLLPHVAGEPLSFSRIAGWVLAPLAWLLGVPWSECTVAGGLLGTKVVLNEFLAYMQLAKLGPGALSEKSRVIITYALCGFANLGSMGILVGGLSAMAPERRAEVVALAPRSVLAGLLATCMTGAVVGILY